MTSPDPIPTTLSDHLRRLGLLHTAAELNDLVARAPQKRWSPIVLLEQLVTAELDARATRSFSSAAVWRRPSRRR